MLKLMYITNNPQIAKIAEDSGVDRIFVDMEFIGKEKRQGGLDTVKNHHTIEDIEKLRKTIRKSELLVRINPVHDALSDYMSTEEEIDQVIKAGADIIMLPFFKTTAEVKRFIDCVNGRARTMLLLETPEAVENLEEILKIKGIDEIHIGLNDLSLGLHMDFMFEPLANGIVESICKKIKAAGIPYGFGGIARIGEGELPSETIIAEHYRLGSTIVILSRSFYDMNKTFNLDDIKTAFKKRVKEIRAVEKNLRKKNRLFFLKNKLYIKHIVFKISKNKNAIKKSAKFVAFITLLRALATIIITNSHYEGVYPNDIIANGGLLGDVIFFAVSGFCLYNIKENFPKWYFKRFIRIFPALWLITIIYIAAGYYSLEEHDILWWFIFPTYYHFVASIMILYIPFYIIFRKQQIKKNNKNTILILLAISLILQTIVYLLFYDKTYYHIDTVREPMIRFLFFDAMMIGAYSRLCEKPKNKMYNWIVLILLLGAYFGSKTLFVKIDSISEYQIVNQFILLALLYTIFRCLAGVNGKLDRMPSIMNKTVSFLASITLEVYLVQYVIIGEFKKAATFPINWLIITSAIIIAAILLHIISIAIQNHILKEKKK